MEFEAFSGPFARLCAVYRVEVTEALADAYYAEFAPFPLEAWTAAVRLVIRSHKYANLPPPAVLWDALEEIARLIGALPKPAEAAWVDVLAAVRDLTATSRSADLLPDPLTYGIVSRMGGVRRVAESIDRARWETYQTFLALYREAQRATRLDAATLAGVLAAADIRRLEAGHGHGRGA